jgi:uroporphyrinogen decarboxylase
MNSKERVATAVALKEPDRVPTGEIGVDYTITEQVLGHKTLYRAKWKEYQALWQGQRDKYVDSCKNDIVALARIFNWDFVPVFLVPSSDIPPSPPKFIDDYTWEEADGRIMRFSPESEGHAVCVQYPDLSTQDIHDEEVSPSPSEMELVEHVVQELGDTHYILGRGGDGTFPHEKYGLTNLLIKMIDDPDFVHRAIQTEVRKSILINEALLDAGCDGILPGDDYSSSQAPMMSPKHFREFILPGLVELCNSAHSKGKHLIKHTDGNVWPIFEMLLDAGIDGWHGIQAKAGMDLRQLKEIFGNRICFWGGVDVDWLVSDTPDQITTAVQNAIYSAGAGGGLVITSGNTIMVGVRYENYLSMLRAVEAYGKYPLV